MGQDFFLIKAFHERGTFLGKVMGDIVLHWGTNDKIIPRGEKKFQKYVFQ